MNVLLALAIALATGLLFSRIMKLLHLPNVTGYLLAGVLIGPYCLGRVVDTGFSSASAVAALEIVSTVALGCISFSIGSEFKLSHLKTIGGQAIVICFLQALSAVALVDVALIICARYGLVSYPVAITLGAIATATAPATTLMVVRQYKARGRVTDILLPVVALDDAIGLIVFSISFSFAKSLAFGGGVTVQGLLLEPMMEIAHSLLLGGGLGLLLTGASYLFHSRANRLTLMLCVVLAAIALSLLWNLSTLLVCMMVSGVFVNLRKEGIDITERLERFTPPIYLLFFVISGARLDFKVLAAVGAIGAIYIIARALGKYFGTFFGAMIVKESKTVRNYLGFTLMPQEGVAIGMATMAATAFPGLPYGQQITAVVLTATLVYELIAPILTKVSLQLAGEIPSNFKRFRLATQNEGLSDATTSSVSDTAPLDTNVQTSAQSVDQTPSDTQNHADDSGSAPKND